MLVVKMMLVDVADLGGCTVRAKVEIVEWASCLGSYVEWDDDGCLNLQRESLARELLRSFFLGGSEGKRAKAPL